MPPIVNILQVGGCLNGSGGDTHHIMMISKCMIRKGHNVRYFPYLPLGGCQKQEYVNRNSISINDIPKIARYQKYAAGSILLAGRYLVLRRKGSFYLPILPYYYGEMLNTIAKEKPDVIHIHGMMLESLPFVKLASEKQIPYLVTSHGSNMALDPMTLHYRPEVENEILRMASKSRAAISSVSTDLAVSLQKRSDKKIHVVFPGIERDRFGLTDRKRITTDKLVIMSVGNLTARKNHKLGILALDLLKKSGRTDISYNIIGGGPEEQNLRKLIESNDLGNQVKLLGRVSPDILVQEYRNSDYCLLPSISEGLAGVILEALSCGLPIITYSDISGVKDIINDSNGIVLNDREPCVLAETIADSAFRCWNPSEVRETTRGFDWADISDKYEGIYREISS